MFSTSNEKLPRQSSEPALDSETNSEPSRLSGKEALREAAFECDGARFSGLQTSKPIGFE